MDTLLKLIEETIAGYMKTQLYEGALMLAKGVAICFVLFEFMHRCFTNLGDKEFSGFRVEDFTKPIFYILLICFFTSLLEVFETTTQAFFAKLENGKPMYQTLIKGQEAIDLVNSKKDKRLLIRILRSPNDLIELISNMFLKLACWVIGIVDIIIYTVFIAERYFLLGLAALLFPFLLAFSALNKFQDYILKGLKAYLAVLVSIYVIGLGMNVGQKLFEAIKFLLSGTNEIIGDPYSEPRTLSEIMEGSSAKGVILSNYASLLVAGSIALFLKLKIIKAGISHLYRVLV